MAQVRKTKWNPRYVEYARSHGRPPTDQQLHDRKFPESGGFLHWNLARWNEAEREIPEAFKFNLISDQAAYDAWLKRWVDDHRNAKTGDLVS